MYFKADSLVKYFNNAEVTAINKGNGVIKNGLKFNIPDSTMSPVLYVEDWNIADIDEMLKKINDTLEECETPDVNVEAMVEWENVKDYVHTRMAPASDVEMLKLQGVPFEYFLDLVIYPVWYDDSKYAMIKITNEMINVWGIDPGTVFTHAFENDEKNV